MYKYKIQWLLNITEIDNILKMIEILGHRSLDGINFYNIRLEHIENFNHLFYSHSQLESLLKELEEYLHDNEDIFYVELLRN
jgi:hypothetical protein